MILLSKIPAICDAFPSMKSRAIGLLRPLHLDEVKGWNAKFGAEVFLSNYWQKRPLLIRGAIDVGAIDVLPDDLIALSQEEDVEARVVYYSKGKQIKDYEPFNFFADSRKKLREPWTVLVQEVGYHSNIRTPHQSCSNILIILA